MLRGLDIHKGDRVVIYMPMIPEAVVAMLACARLGAVHSVVFGGFAAHELAVRIDDATPKLIVSASCGIEVNRVIEYKPILDKAIDVAATSRRTRHRAAPAGDRRADGGRDLDWSQAVAAAGPRPASPSTRPTRSTSCTPRAPRGSRRAWSATTAATRSR